MHPFVRSRRRHMTAVLGFSAIVASLALSPSAVASPASVIVATDITPQAVQEAIDSAQPGDTVMVPAGSNSNWDAAVIIDKAIHLQGAGPDPTPNGTVLKRAVGAGPNMFRIESDGVEFSGFRLKGLGRTNGDMDRGLVVNGGWSDFQIHDSYFTLFGHAGVMTLVPGSTGKSGDPSGVIYDNTFLNLLGEVNGSPNLGYGVLVLGDPQAWNRPLNLGQANFVFIEDNNLDLTRHPVAANNGARYVFRHNVTADSSRPGDHQVDAHGRTVHPRGTRAYEIYENTLAPSTPIGGGPVKVRGGDGVIYNNTIGLNFNNPAVRVQIEKGGPPVGGPYPFPDQTTDLWGWDNTLPDGTRVPVSRPSGDSEYLQEGRDFHNAEKPGYTAYPYPHPLR
jgi:hypothetical protein